MGFGNGNFLFEVLNFLNYFSLHISDGNKIIATMCGRMLFLLLLNFGQKGRVGAVVGEDVCELVVFVYSLSLFAALYISSYQLVQVILKFNA